MKIKNILSKILIKPLAFLIDKYYTPMILIPIKSDWIKRMNACDEIEIAIRSNWLYWKWTDLYSGGWRNKFFFGHFPSGDCKVDISNIKEETDCIFEITFNNLCISFASGKEYNYDIFWKLDMVKERE
jgi:hypothetical protein